MLVLIQAFVCMYVACVCVCVCVHRSVRRMQKYASSNDFMINLQFSLSICLVCESRYFNYYPLLFFFFLLVFFLSLRVCRLPSDLLFLSFSLALSLAYLNSYLYLYLRVCIHIYTYIRIFFRGRVGNSICIYR